MFYTLDKSLTFRNNPLSCPINIFKSYHLSCLHSILQLSLSHCFLPIFKGFFSFLKRGSIREKHSSFLCFHPAVLLAPIVVQRPRPTSKLSVQFQDHSPPFPTPLFPRGWGCEGVLSSLLSAGLPTKQPFTTVHPLFLFLLKFVVGLCLQIIFYSLEPFTFSP